MKSFLDFSRLLAAIWGGTYSSMLPLPLSSSSSFRFSHIFLSLFPFLHLLSCVSLLFSRMLVAKKGRLLFSPFWPFAFPPPLPPTLRLLQRLTKGILIYCRSRRRRRRRGRVCKKGSKQGRETLSESFPCPPERLLKNL